MNKLMSSRNILMVEDEKLILIMIQIMLEGLGYGTIVATASVEAALEQVAKNDFDVAILDINLDGFDSHQVAEALDASQALYLFWTGNVLEDRRMQVSQNPMLKTVLVQRHGGSPNGAGRIRQRPAHNLATQHRHIPRLNEWPPLSAGRVGWRRSTASSCRILYR
ncbi:MAG: response regulator [Candidatus Devosia symbiotica]|nr:response regulator [Candidatus Devosia symbiotica]